MAGLGKMPKEVKRQGVFLDAYLKGRTSYRREERFL